MPPEFLTQNQDAIREMQPRLHQIAYPFERFEDRLEPIELTIGWDQFAAAYDHASITRGALFDHPINQNGFAETSCQFIATMAWGYGNVGYGAWRTAQAVQTPDYEEVLVAANMSILNGNVEEAYNAFHLNYCGPAFFTKYFYFVGRDHLESYPLILDSIVAARFMDTLNLEVERYARINIQANGTIAVGRFNDGYQRYLNDMHQWARDLRCDADQIEMFLFTL